MPCYHPIPAWRTDNQVRLHKALPDATPLHVPCGTCVGCRTTRAQHWALRCRLEAAEHNHTSVTTLTYENANLPPTLQKRDFQLWLKRLRKEHETKLRYYACGEYGEKLGRPHYHAILFGVAHRPRFPNDTHHALIDETWGKGITYTEHANPRAINYITGYTTTKPGWYKEYPEERVDKETGEIYIWQPPFQLMSRGGRNGHGIGANAKQHYQSWALYAINDGYKLSVPRYYKNAYKELATPTEQEETEYNKYKQALTRHEKTPEQLETKERIHHGRQQLKRSLRKYE